MRRAASLLLLPALLVAACGGSGAADEPHQAAGDVVRATVGETVPVDERLAGGDLPDVVSGGGELVWHPADAGTWTVDGVTFEARYPPAPDTLVGLGDSVAAGFGLQNLLTGFPCFRSESSSYPALVVDGLADVTEPDLVACTGATAADLDAQVEAAVQRNPGVVTLTVGANDLRFLDPGRFIDADGEVRSELIDSRLVQLDIEVRSTLERLVEATDAQVVVTGYYNPTATRPEGVDPCTGECFRVATDGVVEQLEEVLRLAVEPYADRVAFAPLQELFAAHGAPDAGDLIESIDAVGPYCSEDVADVESWVSSLDCVHPNEEGQRQIAAAVLQALAR